jgi:hypothetical protein
MKNVPALLLETLYQETNLFCRKWVRGHLQIPTLAACFIISISFVLNLLSISGYFIELHWIWFQVIVVGIFLWLTIRYPSMEDFKYKKPMGNWGFWFTLIYYVATGVFLFWSAGRNA